MRTELDLNVNISKWHLILLDQNSIYLILGLDPIHNSHFYRLILKLGKEMQINHHS